MLLGIELEPNFAIEQKLLEEIGDRVKVSIEKRKDILVYQIGNVVEQAIKVTPEYLSIVSGTAGSLTQELGLVNPFDDMQEIISIIKKGISINNTVTQVFAGKLYISLTLSLFMNDTFERIIDAGKYESENGYPVNWMEWLLTAGKDVILFDYVIMYPQDRPFKASRTGGPIMRKQKFISGGWSMPQFSEPNEQDDNFITRAIESVQQEIEQIITTGF